MPNKKSTKVLIGALGPEKTFSDLACDWYIQKEPKNNFQKKLYASIWEVFDALKKGGIEKGIVPIENNIYGTVRETFDSLFQSKLSIVMQFSLPVYHCLAVKKGTKKSEITKIISHQQALNQCQAYLRKNYPKAQGISFQSTVAAIKKVTSARNLHRAVICSLKAAKDYDLKVLDQNIEDQKKNRTLFAVLSKDPKASAEGKNMRTSVA
ncbi:prephenate dehydratase, partial [Patescibacteria group bacterium]